MKMEQQRPIIIIQLKMNKVVSDSYLQTFSLWFIAASQVGGDVFLDGEVNSDGRLWNKTQRWLSSLPYHTVDALQREDQEISVGYKIITWTIYFCDVHVISYYSHFFTNNCI